VCWVGESSSAYSPEDSGGDNDFGDDVSVDDGGGPGGTATRSSQWIAEPKAMKRLCLRLRANCVEPNERDNLYLSDVLAALRCRLASYLQQTCKAWKGAEDYPSIWPCSPALEVGNRKSRYRSREERLQPKREKMICCVWSKIAGQNRGSWGKL